MSKEYWSKDEVVKNCWQEYKNSDEYKCLGYIPKAIAKNHPIIIKREQRGLRKILRYLQKSLENKNYLYIYELKKRRPYEWITEWKYFHDLLFTVISSCKVPPMLYLV